MKDFYLSINSKFKGGFEITVNKIVSAVLCSISNDDIILIKGSCKLKMNLFIQHFKKVLSYIVNIKI